MYGQLTYAADAINVYTEVFPPYQTLTDDGKMSGWSHHIVMSVLQKADLNYDVHVFPWARAYKSALNDKNGLIYSMMRTSERMPLFNWLVPLCTMQMSFYSLSRRDDINISSFEEINQLKIGITREQAKREYLIKKGFESNLIEVNNNEQLRKMMEFNRVDLIMSSDDYLAHLVAIKELPAGTFKRQFRIKELNNTLYLAANHDLDPALKELITSTYQSMRPELNRACYLNPNE